VENYVTRVAFTGVLGHKWAMTVSFGGHFLWMLANGYAVWATMIPASILVGLCEAPLWTSQMSYLTLAAVRYAALSGEKEDAVMTRFFGIFFTFFQLCTLHINFYAYFHLIY
jgi:hypothetical protein